MKKFYESLIELKDEDEINRIIAGYLKNIETNHKEDIQKYQLWMDYLKRSDKFLQACEWFEETKKKYPYPSELEQYKHKLGYIEDYLVFASTYNELFSESPLFELKDFLTMLKSLRGIDIFNTMISGTFFSWAIESGYPADFEIEMLMNLFVFGNIYKDPVNVDLLRIIHILESRRRVSVYRLNEIIDLIFRHIEKDEYWLNGREPSIDEFKSNLKRFFETDMLLPLCLFNPYENKDKTLELISKLIDERRRVLDDAGANVNHFRSGTADMFESPQQNIRLDELKRYLKAYDLQKDGKSIKKIGQLMYPNSFSSAASLERIVSRDLQKAKKIIKNVEVGFFPGNYQ